MSAILSADDLNDFISPGVACIKPVETLPPPRSQAENPYEVSTEDTVPAESLPPAQISLTDCLACSGCVTSAEAVLVSLQSHSEVLHALDASPELRPENIPQEWATDIGDGSRHDRTSHLAQGRIFVASVSPQTRASLAAACGVTEIEAGYMVEQLLGGSKGLRSGGTHGSGFTWVVDTNVAREACLHLGAQEVTDALGSQTSATAASPPICPILTSSCPGWICYAEKTHPHVLPHLSRLKSPQALLGTLLKTSLSKTLGISPSLIWHVAVMPCFDKKLEGSRSELTDAAWNGEAATSTPSRDVDCVITTREILQLASSRSIDLSSLPKRPVLFAPFPDATLSTFLFPSRHHRPRNSTSEFGTSGGQLLRVLKAHQAAHPGSRIISERGRNADVVEYRVERDSESGHEILVRAARYYGFRNIQNLVRKLKPMKASRMPGAASRQARAASAKSGIGPITEYAYIEVMACPGGCTNGGGQIKASDEMMTITTAVGEAQRREEVTRPLAPSPAQQKEWLAKVDEAYFSSSSPLASDAETDADSEIETNRDIASTTVSNPRAKEHVVSVSEMLEHWTTVTQLPLDTLAYTTFRRVEDSFNSGAHGAGTGTGTGLIGEIAGREGGGW
ncbi:MAG: Cytosolic Fe-S cluster assembly factor nar1 [Thelocarpon superellum]|nr:MAG: Cytosolic Fe-S cluster assembly factor nar1 [Thelocarpon superellum]